jgi:PAS domain-containing protein
MRQKPLSTLDGRVVDVFSASRVGPTSEPGMSLLGVIDITDRKQAEEARCRSEKRYENLFQAMAVSFMELDFARGRCCGNCGPGVNDSVSTSRRTLKPFAGLCGPRASLK